MKSLIEKATMSEASEKWESQWEGLGKGDFEDADDLLEDAWRSNYKLLDFVYRKVGDGNQNYAKDALPHNMYTELSRWKDVIEGFRGDLGKLKKEMTFR